MLIFRRFNYTLTRRKRAKVFVGTLRRDEIRGLKILLFRLGFSRILG